MSLVYLMLSLLILFGVSAFIEEDNTERAAVITRFAVLSIFCFVYSHFIFYLA